MTDFTLITLTVTIMTFDLTFEMNDLHVFSQHILSLQIYYFQYFGKRIINIFTSELRLKNGNNSDGHAHFYLK